MRLIDADTLKAEFTGNFFETYHYMAIRAMIDVAPTIEAMPVVHGEWIKVKEWSTKAKFRCSVCGREIMSAINVNMEKYPYCHCGAKMAGGKE